MCALIEVLSFLPFQPLQAEPKCFWMQGSGLLAMQNEYLIVGFLIEPFLAVKSGFISHINSLLKTRRACISDETGTIDYG